jgi:hypothetical protein
MTVYKRWLGKLSHAFSFDGKEVIRQFDIILPRRYREQVAGPRPSAHTEQG